MLLIILYSVIALYALLHIAFLVGTIKKNNGIMDIFYPWGFITVAWTSLILGGTFALRQIIITIIVTIWGLRLSTYVYIRNRGKPEDKRYANMRERFGDKVLLKSYGKIYMFQGLIIFLVGFPVLYINANPNPALTWLDLIGILVWVFGFYFETAGDYQLYRFLNNPNRTKKVLDEGLWKYTQHPNYFGEVTQWWGVFIIALSVPYGFLTVFGPIIINYMIIKVSGVSLLNKNFEGNDAYADYQRRTSQFIPWFPKKKKE